MSRARPARAAARLALALALVTGARRASAHDVSYAHIELRWSAGRVDGRLTVHPDDAAMVLAVPEPAWFRREDFLARAGPALADSLRRRFALRADGRDLAWTLTGTRPDPEGRGVQLEFFAPLPRAVAALEVAGPVFPQVANHETFVNVFRDGGLLRQDVLTAGHRVTRVYGRGAPGALAVLRTFVPAGVHHIAIGPDHILFVLGLLLLGGGLVRLLKVVTSFTIAHSITLALASLGLVRLPGRLVEPLIALSIVFVAIETLRAQKGSLARGAPARGAGGSIRAVGPRSGVPANESTHRHPAPAPRGPGHDRRAPLAFGFGLVHGFGFASVLAEFGLPREALGWSLLGFNLGVEIGQAVIVLAIAPALALLARRAPPAHVRTVRVLAAGIAVAGAYWFVQRALGR